MPATSLHPVRTIDWTPIKQQLRDVARFAPLMSWLCEPDGYCIYLNPLWFEFTGQVVDDALGMGWTQSIHPQDRARAFELYVNSAALLLPYHAEYRLRRAGSSYEWVASVAQPFFDEDGQLIGYVGSDASRDTLSGARSDSSKVLTLREREAVTWAAQGLTSSEAALKMGITARTVESFMTFAAIKLGAANRTHTVVEAIRRGEISL